MPEKFDFSKIEDQKEFEPLPQEEKDKIVGEVQGEMEIENAVEREKIKNLRELININSSVDDIVNLQGQKFKIAAEDLDLLIKRGNKEREISKNSYNQSIEGNVFLSYLINKLEESDFNKADLETLKASREKFKEYLADPNPQRKNESEELKELSKLQGAVLHEIEKIKNISSLQKMKGVLESTNEYFNEIRDVRWEHLKTDDKKLALDISHYVLYGWEPIYGSLERFIRIRELKQDKRASKK